MKIKEVESLLDKDRSLIRYYIERDLIRPQQRGNGYRDFSNKDIDQIKRIIILRHLQISVADISRLQKGEIDMKRMLDVSFSILNQKRKRLDAVMQICREMMDDDGLTAMFDPEKYYSMIQGGGRSC